MRKETDKIIRTLTKNLICEIGLKTEVRTKPSCILRDGFGNGIVLWINDVQFLKLAIPFIIEQLEKD